MIFTITYNETCDNMSIGGWGIAGSRSINPYQAIRNTLEATEDTVIFVVTPHQLPGFQNMLGKYGLDRFLIVDHRTDGKIERGVTNRNYPHIPRKLKLFVLKGAKSHA